MIESQEPQIQYQTSSIVSDQISKAIQQQDTQRTNQKKFQHFIQLSTIIQKSVDYNKIAESINQYAMLLVKNQADQTYFQHFVQSKFISLLLQKLHQSKFSSQIVKAVFCCLEFLLKAMKKQDQYVYLMVSINRQGFLAQKYKFSEQEDAAYYANFLKFLARKINEDQKYLSIFFNNKQPHFPLLLNLLRFHDSKDLILHTSVKLTLIQICANPNKAIQNYISNFPFVIFYPLYVYQIYQAFFDSISQDTETSIYGLQNLQNSLKFMQDFIQNKDKKVIQMYTNCFQTLIGRVLYKQLSELSVKNLRKVKNMLNVLLKTVVKQTTVIKIKIGLGQFFTKYIGKNLRDFLRKKTSHLQKNYWLIDECLSDVKQHCNKIFKDGTQVKRSILKTFSSYIPSTKNNWMYYQIKKISQLIGFQILLNQNINSQVYLKGSYLQAIEKDLDSSYIQNQAYINLLKYDDQQLLFYYIKFINALKIPFKKQGLQIDQESETILNLLTVISRATSLSVIKVFYEFVRQNQVLIDEHKFSEIKSLYEGTLDKIIYFILTEGWQSFKNRSKIDLRQQNNQNFSPDIFRDLQCEFLFFIAIRHLLGTSNQNCQQSKYDFSTKDLLSKQVKIPCLLIKQQSNVQANIVLDGQYLKIVSDEDILLSKQIMSLHRMKIYQDQQKSTFQFVIADDRNSFSFLVKLKQQPLRSYISRQIKWRKQISQKHQNFNFNSEKKQKPLQKIELEWNQQMCSSFNFFQKGIYIY